MSFLSISPLPLLVLLLLLPLSSPWCYKSFFPIQGQASIMDVSPDNAYMAITSINQNLVQVYDLTTYNILLNYTPPTSTVASAKFTRDGTYLGVGLSNGLIYLLSGRPTFNTTIINNVTAGNNLVDIDFNINNDKMVACYSSPNKFDIISNYTGNGLPSTPVGTTNGIYRCKFSLNDDVGLIDTNKMIRIYRSSASSFITSIQMSSSLKNFDIRPLNGTPIKFIGAGNDNRGYFALDNNPSSMTSSSFTFSSTLSGGSMSSACYSGDAVYYAFVGSSSDPRVFIFNENNTLSSVYNNFINPSNNQPSTCRFSNDGSTLYVGSLANNNLAYIYVYKESCFQCPLGYYLSSGTSCSLCSSGVNMSLCLSCNNASSCLSCIVGYYLNTTNKQCYKCDYAMEGCATCANHATCYECNFNYFLNTTSRQCKTCSSVITGCLICNGTSNSTCLNCSQQYYLFNGSCIRCNNGSANCLKCSSNTTCLQCLFGFFANSTGACVSCNTNCTSCYNSAANCSTCARGFYVSSSFACTPCSAFCMECNNTNYCFDCQAGTFLTANGTCTVCGAPCDSCNSTGCLNCIAGFYLSGTTCSYCSTNCTSCLNSTNCSTCAFGTYLTASNLCLSCSSLFPGCSSCNLTQCFSCVASNYLNASNLCASCVTGGCLVCNTSSSCQACAIGYFLTSTFSCSTCAVTCESCSGASTTCTSCIPGTYLSGSNCLYCANNCQTCNGTACFSCNIGYYISSGSCSSCHSQIYGCTDCLNGTYCTSCQLGKYLNSTNLCSECSSNCGSCNSTTCLSCNAGYFLNSSNSCVKCLNNCSECYSATSCFSCNPGFYLNGAACATCWGVSRGCLTCNTTICFNCQQGYYLNSSNLCSNCQATITNCLYCLSSSSCQACAQGYYLNAAATACTLCHSTIDGCQSCINSTNCVSCAIGYYLNGNSCTACASKCMTCNSTGCITCAFRYSFNSSDCLTCSSLIQYCQICSNGTTCLRCFQGFYVSSGSCTSCQSNLVGCSYCNTSAICTSCMSGYYLNGNVCTICSSTQGCKLCSSSSNCSLCSTGYALSSTTCVTCASLLPNCVYCANATACTECSAGYYVNGLVCSKCTAVSAGCILCSNGTQCLQCEGGYYLNGLVCSACSVLGCQLCTSLSPTQCINCYTGYYLNGTSCLSCNVSGCIDCNQSNSCISCQLGYYLDASSTCSLCSNISGCSKCSSAVVCTECQTLYYLSGNTCTPCSNTLVGCAFCTNSSSCLSCNSGYYLNSSALCSVCTALTGCLLCTDMTTCTYCNSGYYLLGGACFTCTNISQCAQCINATTCSACISGYALSSGTCTVISGSTGGSSSSGSAAQTVKNLKLKSYYVSPTMLKHVLLAVGMTYKQVTASWSTEVKLYIGSKTTSTLLTIQKVEWGKANELIFYTNNPLNLNVKSLQFVNRLLIGQTVTVNLNSSAQISQPLLAIILPNLLADSSLTLGYSLDDPEFYNSYIQSVYNTYYYVIGIVLTCVLFFNFFMKAFCTVTHSTNHGYIMGHIFALKTVSISLYPTYGEYINYSYGYMTADLPYINKWVGALLSDSADDTPLGYLLFYANMSMFSMYLLALAVYLLALGMNYLCFSESGSSKFKLEKNSQYLKRKEYSRFKAVNQFLTNFFYFGLTFAGCASLQGSILNPYNIISLNGVGYVIGIIVYMALLGQCFNSAYNQWNFQRLRLFVKATFLSLAHFNPIYILVVVLTLDVSLFIVEAKLKQKYIVNFKLFIVNQILVNFALAFIYYLPDSLLAIYISAAAVGLAVIIELFMHYKQKKIQIKDYPFFSKEQITSSDKPLPSEDINWKLNLQDYTLEKEVHTKTHFMDKDLRDENNSRPLMATQDQSQEMITRTTNFKEETPQASPEKRDRRARRFREANKNRNTILNSSWTSFDLNSSF